MIDYLFKEFKNTLSNIFNFTKILFLNFTLSKKEIALLINNIYFAGTLSLGSIIFSALFIGMVVGLQGNHMIGALSVESVLGKMAALTICRELGPVVTTLLFIGRTCSSITAKICLMKITDQLSVIEVMGINSIKKIIVPKFIASVLSLNLLCMIFMFFSLLGSYLSSVYIIGIDSNNFLYGINSNLSIVDEIINAILKSFIFSLIVTYIAVFQGINSKPTIESIGMSTTNTVVYSTLSILLLNLVLTSIMF